MQEPQERMRFQNVSMQFPTDGGMLDVVSDMSFSINQGDFVALVGPSGCGKTTLMNMAAGFVKPTSGRVTLDGSEISGPGPDRGVMFQEYGVFPWLTVEQNIAFGLELKANSGKVSAAERRDIVERYGKLDILFANAGGASNHAAVAELTDEAMQDSLVWNFWHTFWTMQTALKHMIPAGGGRIIAMSSVEGKMGKPGLSIYVAAKHAINGLVKSAAQEVGTLGITVNSVCPGAIETDIMQAEGPGAAESMGITYEELLDMFAQESAIKRLNAVEDVAEVCVLLASDAGAGITGSLISIDGGTSPY